MSAVRLGVDIDDVLHAWYDKAHDWCAELGLAPQHPRPQTWAPFNEYPDMAPEDWFEALALAVDEGEHLYLSDPIPGAVYALNKARNAGHEIHLITNRGQLAKGTAIKGLTLEWIERHNIPHDSITFTRDKVTVCRSFDITHAIDDSIKNLKAYKAAKVKFAVQHRPWNADFQHPWRVDHIQQFVDQIIEEQS